MSFSRRFLTSFAKAAGGAFMGAGIAVEVTGFTFMAIFISRLGETPVAGHQIAANLVSLLFMVPMALGNATSTLAAQSIGAGALAVNEAGVDTALTKAAGLGIEKVALPAVAVTDVTVVGAGIPAVNEEATAIWRQMVRPRPVPPEPSLVRLLCTKGSKMASTRSASTPGMRRR